MSRNVKIVKPNEDDKPGGWRNKHTVLLILVFLAVLPLAFGPVRETVANFFAHLNQDPTKYTLGYQGEQSSTCTIKTENYQGCARVHIDQYEIENTSPVAVVTVSWNIPFENLRTLPITVGIQNSAQYYTKELVPPMYETDILFDKAYNAVTAVDIAGMNCDMDLDDPTVWQCRMETLAPAQAIP